MLAWQRRARLGIVAVAVTVSAAVYVSSRRRVAPPVPPAVARVDPAAVIESSGAFVRDVKGEKERFRVEADRQLTYADGTTKLMGVKVIVEREGKTFVVRGDEARVGDNQSSVQLTGHVHLEGSDGLKLDAASASYSEGEGIVRAPGPVTFSRGTMNGKGVDFTYDRNRDAIGLADQSAITVAPDKNDTAGADITAGAALLARKDRFMSFERSVHIIRGSQIIDADRAVADLTEDEKHITALDLNGGARITKSVATPGGLTAMAASNISLAYEADSELIERAVLSGASAIRIAGEKGSPEKALAADSLEIGLAPDGATVTSLNARDKVVLDLPAPRGQPSKGIRSNGLVASGDAAHGLTAAVFSEGVEYRETGGAPPVQRLVRSRNLDAALNNGLGDIRDARFTGNVQFNDGATHATAANVRYQVASGSVDLTGSVGNVPPRVVDDQIEVDAVHIEMVLDGPKMTATDAVRTVLKPAKPGANGATATKMPGLMQQGHPVNGISDKLIYDGANGSSAEFTGNARLFQQGETSIQGDKIVVEGRSGNLQAAGLVKSTLLVSDIDPKTSERSPTRTTATAGELLYDDAVRRMTYNTDAHLNGPQGDIVATHIVLSLAKDSQDVERLEAAGAVTLKENGRVTTGDKLLYVADGQKYVVSGKLVKMLEPSCRESSGQILTFDKATDNLRIEGNDETRTQSIKSVGCIPRVN